MSTTRRSILSILALGPIVVAGAWLWSVHAAARGLGDSSPILGYDAAQYAVAARELSDHGRLATPFALPLELSRHPRPPWPLALVQPGLVAAEAALFGMAGGSGGEAERRAWLVLVVPGLCYLATAVVLALAVAGLMARRQPAPPPPLRMLAGAVVALVFLLDPEAQRYATGGFTEPPFTLGLVAALAAIGAGWAGRRPLLFGLLLGVAGTFRGNMLWLAPVLAAAAAWSRDRDGRAGAFARALAGYALVLSPWWIYKWIEFGTPAWDLSWVAIWDGVAGQTWFTLNHLPQLPDLPSGAAAAGAIAAKVLGNVPRLLLELARGPRALWIGALAIGVLAARAAARAGGGVPEAARPPVPRPERAAAIAALGVLALAVAAAAASVPQARYLFPARAAAEAAGLLALWRLIAAAPEPILGSISKPIVAAAVGALAVVWGGLETARGWNVARAEAESRGVPSEATLRDLSARLDRELGPGEPVMSNLGPVLAWYARRPVVHLALSPADVDECRRLLDLRTVLLVFREPARAWSEWPQVLERPEEAAHRPEWNVTRAVRFETRDGFVAVWLELGALAAPVASDGVHGLAGTGSPSSRYSDSRRQR